MDQFDVVIIGAGAAGLMCALTAGARGRRVLLLEHAAQAGAKILISGGGRCNFTNRDTAPDRFFSGNPHFCKSALKRYTQHDFIALVQRHGIAYHEKTLGQLFCDGSARAIVAMLLAECAAAGVDLRVGHRVIDITKADRFRVETDHGDFAAGAVVLATGGLSIPKMGATGFAHDMAARFGLKLTETRPALVPLTFTGEDLAVMQPLSGVAVDVQARCDRRAFRESMLFTHRGLSGPAVLQISSCWHEGKSITLDMTPGSDAAAFLLERKRTRPNAELKTILGEILPQRLAQKLVETRFVNRPINAMRDKELAAIAGFLKAWQVVPSGTEGYAKAEVTLGGVDTAGLSSRTMQAGDVPGLYVIGEAVDVTGWLGGYNFQWAWSSGWSAGQAV
ncbi:BaiN/RdsA family NAD(P)/FAD-dependent oxidoreductase [Limobrevibacterium gyesilva]|uniref:NAD(P)/FAD-dependent oxidoreductase n=1 Tax=Limobrevibacterium gyesilva TaxID=2991712 RepID=A0AA41YUA3_9PROT|nr:NAD(P)/FAD-dependent oxidoreductase [Limobrevibacterium gyesilva]MCW3475542.1 NAD(P)/FAD-dependent oxidoreductase [Limobrevibacterium gyesilva]